MDGVVVIIVPSLRDAGFAARVVVLGSGFSCACVWLFEDLDGWMDGLSFSPEPRTRRCRWRATLPKR